jgi:hypothetical protein
VDTILSITLGQAKLMKIFLERILEIEEYKFTDNEMFNEYKYVE